MGPTAVTPAEARFGAVTMALLAFMAVVVAAMVYRSTHAVGQTMLFVALAAVGTWQAAYYHRLEKQ